MVATRSPWMLPAGLGTVYLVWGSTYLAIRIMVETMPPLLGAGARFAAAGAIFLAVLADRPGDAPLWGVLLIVAASISWAAGSFYSKRMDLPADTFVSTAFQMLLGGAAMVVTGLLAGEAGDVDVGAFSARSLAAFAYLIVFGSLLAYTAYTWLLQHAPISTVATYAYVNPVIAVVLGAVVLSEEITPTVLVGAAAIVLSVAAVVRREADATQARRRLPWLRRGSP